MSRPVIYLAFANNKEIPQAYLPLLKRESSNIYDKLLPLHQKEFIELYRENDSSVESIFKSFRNFKDRVAILHYGGHASSAQLMLEALSGKAEAAHAEGLAGFLGQQANLQLVFLNGCSTKEQAQLLMKAGVKAVIATSIPINDAMAVEFSEQFYSSMVNEADISRAYQEAKSFIQTKYGFQQFAGEIKQYRDVALEAEQEQPKELVPWNLYLAESDPSPGAYKFPQVKKNLTDLLSTDNRIKKNTEVNQHIILPVFEALQKYNNRLQTPLNDFDEPNLSEIKSEIIKNFPLPIGTQLRKLFAKSPDTETFGLPRLRQILNTYETLVKLLCFTMLSQLWDEAIARSSNGRIKSEGQTLVDFNSFFTLNENNYQTFNFYLLLSTLSKIFRANKIKPFIEEFEEMYNFLEKEDSDLTKAFVFLEEIRKGYAEEAILAQNIEEYCNEGEFHLATILKEAAYLTHYRLVTIKDILFRKFRHEEPFYTHKLGILKGIEAGLIDVQVKDYAKYTDSQSIILVKSMTDLNESLSLSPFIIDQNAFTGHENFKIYFYAFTGPDDTYSCEFVDTHSDRLDINKENYPFIKTQFENFKKEVSEAIV